MGETEGTAGGGGHGYIQSCLLSPWITLTGKQYAIECGKIYNSTEIAFMNLKCMHERMIVQTSTPKPYTIIIDPVMLIMPLMPLESRNFSPMHSLLKE